MNVLLRAVYKGVIVVLTVASTPFQLLIGVFVLLGSGYPIVFVQRRIGKDGAPFAFYKFRTMKRGADEWKGKYAHLNEADGPVFKIHDDPRFTRIGRFLSHTGLDELPQLWNILRGDMALVGPRPLPVNEVKKLKKWQYARHAVKPGIISPWVVDGYHRQTFDAWMRSDIAYAKNKSVWVDVVLLVKASILFLRLLTKEMIVR